MVRAFVLYAEQPEPNAYAEHVALCSRVAGSTFRHGPIFGSPGGEPGYRYYAEFEFADRAGFEAALRSEEFAATGVHARQLGVRFEVFFADVA
jgi:hypothetical protein